MIKIESFSLHESSFELVILPLVREKKHNNLNSKLYMEFIKIIIQSLFRFQQKLKPNFTVFNPNMWT